MHPLPKMGKTGAHTLIFEVYITLKEESIWVWSVKYSWPTHVLRAILQPLKHRPHQHPLLWQVQSFSWFPAKHKGRFWPKICHGSHKVYAAHTGTYLKTRPIFAPGCNNVDSRNKLNLSTAYFQFLSLFCPTLRYLRYQIDCTNIQNKLGLVKIVAAAYIYERTAGSVMGGQLLSTSHACLFVLFASHQAHYRGYQFNQCSAFCLRYSIVLHCYMSDDWS